MTNLEIIRMLEDEMVPRLVSDNCVPFAMKILAEAGLEPKLFFSMSDKTWRFTPDYPLWYCKHGIMYLAVKDAITIYIAKQKKLLTDNNPHITDAPPSILIASN